MRAGQLVSTAAIPHSIAGFEIALAQLDPNAVIALGLMLLIALPIIRVALTVALFLLERDYAYLAITLFVLSVLLSGIVLGRAL